MSKKTLGTFEHQAKLPPLPVAKLEPSLARFLASVEPLLTPAEFQETQKLANDFAKTAAPELDALLRQRAKDCDAGARAFLDDPEKHRSDAHPDGSPYPNCHWLEQWWENYAYLAGRDSLCCYLNVFNPLYGSKPLLGNIAGVDESASCERAAWTAAGFLDFHRLLGQGKFGAVPPEAAGKIVLCSAQYYRIFSTTRVPHENMDAMETHTGSSHVCVERKGHWYVVNDPNSISVEQLHKHLCWIKQDADQQPHIPKSKRIAAFTTENRDTWARARDDLLKDPTNRKALRAIETGMFNIILSEDRPANPDEVQNLSQHCGGSSLWFDKSLTIIQFDNGVTGANLEHTSADAVVPARMLMYAGEFATQNGRKGIGYPHSKFLGIAGVPITKKGFSDGASISGGTKPTRVTWKLSAQDEQRLADAYKFGQEIIADNNLCVLTFDDFGAKTIMKNTKVPTDSFMQMVLALAYARDQRPRTGQTVPPTYETAMTRGFFHGRTETIRSQSMHSKRMVEAFDDPSVPVETKRELFMKAAKYHRDFLRQCMVGQGCDRYLMGLKLIAMENGKPMHPFYESKAYTGSTNFQLSTSQLPWGATDYPGFGAPGPDAYGVCYRFSVTDKIRATVSSRSSCKDKDAVRFRQVITDSLRDVMKVMLVQTPAKL